jgi:hypothetical protein
MAGFNEAINSSRVLAGSGKLLALPGLVWRGRPLLCGKASSGRTTSPGPRIAIEMSRKPQKGRSPSRDVCYRDFGRNPRLTPGG